MKEDSLVKGVAPCLSTPPLIEYSIVDIGYSLLAPSAGWSRFSPEGGVENA